MDKIKIAILKNRWHDANYQIVEVAPEAVYRDLAVVNNGTDLAVVHIPTGHALLTERSYVLYTRDGLNTPVNVLKRFCEFWLEAAEAYHQEHWVPDGLTFSLAGEIAVDGPEWNYLRMLYDFANVKLLDELRGAGQDKWMK